MARMENKGSLMDIWTFYEDRTMKKTMIAALVFVPVILITGCSTTTGYYDTGYRNTYTYSTTPNYYYSGYNNGYNNVGVGLLGAGLVGYGLGSSYYGGNYRGWHGAGWRNSGWRGGGGWHRGGGFRGGFHGRR